jgi:PmbA protein
MSQELNGNMEKALALAMKKAQGAEVSLGRGRNASASYEDDKLKRVSVSQTTHLGVRVIVEGKVGSAYTSDPEEAEAAVARALELAEFGSEAKFEFPGQAPAAEVKLYDASIERIGKEELVAAGEQMLELVKAYNPEIKVGASASWGVGERRLVNSSGLDITDQGSSYGANVGGVLIRGTDMLFVGYGRGWRQKKIVPRELAERAIEQFRLAERMANVASKTMPVIFSPRASYVLLMSPLMGINGKNVLKGDSPLAGRLGEKIASDCFSLVDDATIDYAPASGRYDGEGTPRRRTEIVKDGVLACFLYDLETAGKAGAAPTGHGPGCGTSNVIIPPGELPLAEMVKGTREGLLVEHVMGMGQSNIMNGDFSVNLSLAYKIENGEIVGRVKDVMLAGNAYEALKRVEAIGADPEWTGLTCAPAIKIEALSAVSKG